MIDNTQDRSVGIKFVQFDYNSSYHSVRKRSLYSAMFDCEARIGLTSSSLPNRIISTVETEEDLLSTLSNNVSSPADVPSYTSISGNLATRDDQTDIQISPTTDDSQQIFQSQQGLINKIHQKFRAHSWSLYEWPYSQNWKGLS